ncbi:MAG: hypothetical protein MZW92_39710 [Comamonadaceae bacterium]|nr:hypothetical protein [Comamonadaceae bacterium]
MTPRAGAPAECARRSSDDATAPGRQHARRRSAASNVGFEAGALARRAGGAVQSRWRMLPLRVGAEPRGVRPAGARLARQGALPHRRWARRSSTRIGELASAALARLRAA